MKPDWILSTVELTRDARGYPARHFGSLCYAFRVQGINLNDGKAISWTIPATSLLNGRYDLSKATVDPMAAEYLQVNGRVLA